MYQQQHEFIYGNKQKRVRSGRAQPQTRHTGAVSALPGTVHKTSNGHHAAECAYKTRMLLEYAANQHSSTQAIVNSS